jgi:pyrimidine-nucleoside phosphorylase
LTIQDIIRKKRDRAALTNEEVEFFIEAVTHARIADYQAAALLMAIFLNGLNASETACLTDAMLRSGEVLNFSDIAEPKVDKHSTGGVGDKTSLILAPLVAACGACVPMISGRGLGHTGGTLDKLEAIPGFRVQMSLAEFRAILKRVGFAMIGQTGEIAPADRKLYALRGATETIEAIPLIVASIMSKKLAAGLDALVLDVKTGSGAFMSDETCARQLAHALVATGNRCGVRTQALLTDMNQPLGSAVGNALETKECIELLRGELNELTKPALRLSLELAARMIHLARIEKEMEAALPLVERVWQSGAALEKFRASVEAQGGDARVCDDPSQLMPLSLDEVKVESMRAGRVAKIDAAEIGRAVVALGGGRMRVEDHIDPAVGFITLAKIGDEVKQGDALGIVYGRDQASGERAAARIRAAYTIVEEAEVSTPTLIKEIIGA